MSPDPYNEHNTGTPCPGCGAPIHTVWTNDDPGSPWTECGGCGEGTCATYCYAVEIDGQSAAVAADVWEQCGTGRPPNLATMTATLRAHTVATLETLAARAISLSECDESWGTDEAIAAENAYVMACEEVGYHFEEDEDAQRFAYSGPKATADEIIAYTLPRAIAAARNN
jgi:hypothetical protein